MLLNVRTQSDGSFLSLSPIVASWHLLVMMSFFLALLLPSAILPGSLGEPPYAVIFPGQGPQHPLLALFLSVAPVIMSKSLSQMLEGSILLSLGTSITTSQVS